MLSFFLPYSFSLSSLLWYLVKIFAVTAPTYFFFVRRQRKRAVHERQNGPRLSDSEKDEIIAHWRPIPLVPSMDKSDNKNGVNISSEGLPRLPEITGKVGKHVTLDGKRYFNMATMNFQGFVGEQRIEVILRFDDLRHNKNRYGVGSCGPRSFYGTVDVHIDLERQLAEYMGCEEAILYSYGFATIASAIPAYAKKDDVVFVDKGVNFAIQKGVQASRSSVHWFNHNDMEDLERLLIEHEEWAKKNQKKAKTTRTFIIVEGLYAKSADLCPLPHLIDLKWKYRVRIFMDESLSFGVIGKMGKGLTEHFGINIVDIDMIMISLENAMATTGGFCLGRKFLIEHQRLASLGYVFSASLPPLLTTAASKALEIMENEPERFSRLRESAKLIHSALIAACSGTCFEIIGIDISPLKHIAMKGNEDGTKTLDALVEESAHVGILVTRAHYLNRDEAFPVRQSIKVTCTVEMTSDELEDALEKLTIVIKKVSKTFQ